MKHKTADALKGSYILAAGSLFLPWFTYNASMMGYCWGYQFLPWFLVPCFIIGLSLFKSQGNATWTFLTEVSLLTNLGLFVFALGYWQRLCNIRDGFQLMDGLHTAQGGYWLSLGLHTALFILFRVHLYGSNKEETP